MNSIFYEYLMLDFIWASSPILTKSVWKAVIYKYNYSDMVFNVSKEYY